LARALIITDSAEWRQVVRISRLLWHWRESGGLGDRSVFLNLLSSADYEEHCKNVASRRLFMLLFSIWEAMSSRVGLSNSKSEI
jgi:hypothetical protein